MLQQDSRPQSRRVSGAAAGACRFPTGSLYCAPAYNRSVTESDPRDRSAILSRDTSADVERLQIDAWRRMTS